MNDLYTVQKAEAYLNVHLTRTGPGGTRTQTGPFVTISREAGTTGSALAETLRQRLSSEDAEHPWTVYSRNLIDDMLRSNELPGNLARFLPEDHVSEVDASIGELVGLHPNLWTLVEKTKELMQQVARAGHVVLLGRGASFVTRMIAGGIHVRLVASPEYRAKVTADRFSLEASAARARNNAVDAARRRYVKWTFNADISDPTAYDLVLNVERLSNATIADFIVQLLSGGQAVPASSGGNAVGSVG